MCGPGRPAYKGCMNAPHPTATAFLDALVCRDFARLAATIAPDATMRGLVPRGHLDWDGREEVMGRFVFWFGGTDDIDLLEHGSEEVGGRALLAWRFRLRQERFGEQWHVIAQRVFCDVGADGLIERIDLLCSGFIPEPDRSEPAGAPAHTLVEVGS
jgi:hypothetical protein